MMRKHGKCAYCGQEKTLCSSHAIPYAFFKEMLRKGDGKAIAIPAGHGRIHFDSDSGADYLLCVECESYFNTEFDRPLIFSINKFNNNEDENKLSIVSEIFVRSLASIVWRACVSNAVFYSHIQVNKVICNYFLQLFSDVSKNPLDYCSVGVSVLHDPLPVENGGFDKESLKQVVFPISMKHTGYNNKKHNTHMFLKMCFGGFLIEIFVPRLPFMVRKSPKFIRKNCDSIRPVLTDIFSHDELREHMVSGYKKYLEGDVSAGVIRSRS